MMLKVNKISALILEFAAYSFIGWAYETILTSAVWGRFAERGWLHLPICPIYGFCALALLLILRKIKNPFLIFLAGTAVTTAAELAASYVVWDLAGSRLWDYDNWAFNFEGRIALGSSVIFGVLCVLLMKVLHPAAKYLADKVGGRVLNISAAVTLAAILADTAATLAGL
ncbi:MAG: putative ABC transporter permease [Ruminococcus sp.]|nr:putative ABC transporter permease [Ruminococcus sp.]MCM1478959.1 putative ABC transporter permease [Muribaculaceae bacterium]